MSTDDWADGADAAAVEPGATRSAPEIGEPAQERARAPRSRGPGRMWVAVVVAAAVIALLILLLFTGIGLTSALTPKRFTTKYLGGPPKAHPDRLRAVTSSTYLSPQAPPTLIIEPDNDSLIPTRSVLDFAHHAARIGVEISLVHVPFANHSYDHLAAGSLGNQLRLSVTTHYLQKRGLAPPT